MFSLDFAISLLRLHHAVKLCFLFFPILSTKQAFVHLDKTQVLSENDSMQFNANFILPKAVQYIASPIPK